MLRKTFTLSGMLFVAAALIFLTPGPSDAAFHGGFHVGGFHLGGYHVGSYNYHPYYAGYHRGWYHHYPYFGGYYGLYPYSGGYYGYYPYYDYSGLTSGTAYYPGYGSYYYQPAPSSADEATLGGSTSDGERSAAVGTSPARADTRAHFTVNVPADARLWFNNTPMTATGPVRQFNSAPLTPGSRYMYDITASWNENGHEVTQKQNVQFDVGTHVNVYFPLPPKPTEQASANTHR